MTAREPSLGLPPGVQPSPEFRSRFQIQKLLGEGTQGRVFLAQDRALERAVALKVIHPGAGPGALARLEREARLAASFEHPHLVRLWDQGVLPSGHVYLVYEALEGESLESVLKRNPERARRHWVPWGIQLLEGLDCLHRRGVFHRDLKPANCMVVEDQGLVLLDFGLAFDSAEVTRLTRTGAVVGTPRFFSPEFLLEGVSTVQTDLWAVGVILFVCRLGTYPRPPKLLRGILPGIEEGTLALEDAPGLDPAEARLLARAFHEDSSQRFLTAEEFAHALGELLPGGPASSRGSGAFPAEVSGEGASRSGPGIGSRPRAGPLQGPGAISTSTPPPARVPGALSSALPVADQAPPRGSRLPVALGLLVALVLGLGLGALGSRRGSEPKSPEVASKPPSSSPRTVLGRDELRLLAKTVEETRALVSRTLGPGKILLPVLLRSQGWRDRVETLLDPAAVELGIRHLSRLVDALDHPSLTEKERWELIHTGFEPHLWSLLLAFRAFDFGVDDSIGFLLHGSRDGSAKDQLLSTWPKARVPLEEELRGALSLLRAEPGAPPDPPRLVLRLALRALGPRNLDWNDLLLGEKLLGTKLPEPEGMALAQAWMEQMVYVVDAGLPIARLLPLAESGDSRLQELARSYSRDSQAKLLAGRASLLFRVSQLGRNQEGLDPSRVLPRAKQVVRDLEDLIRVDPFRYAFFVPTILARNASGGVVRPFPTSQKMTQLWVDLGRRVERMGPRFSDKETP